MSISDIEKFSPFYNTRDKLWQHIKDRFEARFEEAGKKRDNIHTKEDLSNHIKYVREKFIESIGGIPYDENLPLNSKTTGVIEEKNMIIEKVMFESRPDVYVTATLYIPKKRKQPCGAVLYQLGHAVEGKLKAKSQWVSRRIASAGLVVLVTEPMGQGERFNYYEETLGDTIIGGATAEHQYAGEQCLLLGDNIIRYFICDAMKGIDYLISRPEVDKDRIGATGSSGGGTMTSCLMLCDERIKAAAPGTFITTRREILYSGVAQDSEQIWGGAAVYGLDHHELLMSFAPKPLLLLTVDADFFPIEGSEEVYRKCVRFWEMYGLGDNFKMVTDKSEHAYTDVLSAASASFFAKTLNGEEREVDKDCLNILEEKELWCTKKGQVKAEYENAKLIFDENLERFAELKKQTNKRNLEEFLLEKINFERDTVKINLRNLTPMFEKRFRVQPYMWFTQKHMPNFSLEFSDLEKKPEKIVVCLWDGGTDKISKNIDTIKKICDDGNAAFVVDLTAMGKVAPDSVNPFEYNQKHGTIDKLSKDLLWLGDSMCALRLFELKTDIEFLTHKFGCEVLVYAKGRFTLMAKLLQKVKKDIKIILSDEVADFEEIIKTKYYDDTEIFAFSIPEILKYL